MNPLFPLPRHLILMKLAYKLWPLYGNSHLHSKNKTIQKIDNHAYEHVNHDSCDFVQ